MAIMLTMTDSFIAVTHDWTYRYQSYFSSTQTLALTIFGIAAGIALIWLRRFKVSITACGPTALTFKSGCCSSDFLSASSVAVS
jgi:hypothetical protein